MAFENLLRRFTTSESRAATLERNRGPGIPVERSYPNSIRCNDTITEPNAAKASRSTEEEAAKKRKDKSCTVTLTL